MLTKYKKLPIFLF